MCGRYEPIRAICDKYPEWLAENEPKLKKEEYEVRRQLLTHPTTHRDPARHAEERIEYAHTLALASYGCAVVLCDHRDAVM